MSVFESCSASPVGALIGRYLVGLMLIIASFPVLGVPASAAEDFSDMSEAGFHAPAVEILDHVGIVTECDTDRFCPGEPMRRWVMAVWINRALGLEDPEVGGSGVFSDVGNVWWAGHVERLTDLGVTVGCDRGSTRYCPFEAVTRGQMATFLVRAFDLPPVTTSVFTDLEGSVHAANIEALAAAGMTAGCATYLDYYCPEEPVTRGQMATFLARVMGLVPPAEFSTLVAEHSIGHLVSRFTTYHKCCQNRVVNIHRFADKLSGAVIAPWDRFSLNRHVGKRTVEDGFRAAGTLVNGELVNTVGGGVSQAATTIYNAIFWGGYRPVTHRPHSIYIPRYPEGIEATINWPDIDLVFRNDTPHHVLVVADYTATSLTVAFYGDNDGRVVSGEWKDGEGGTTVLSEGGPAARIVTASVSERSGWRNPPKPLIRAGSGLDYDGQTVVQTAQVGWTVRVVRTVETGGSELPQTWTVRYSPRRMIVEVHPCAISDSCPDADEPQAGIPPAGA